MKALYKFKQDGISQCSYYTPDFKKKIVHLRRIHTVKQIVTLLFVVGLKRPCGCPFEKSHIYGILKGSK